MEGEVECEEKVVSQYLPQDTVLEMPQVVDADTVDSKALAQEGADSLDELAYPEASSCQLLPRFWFIQPVQHQFGRTVVICGFGSPSDDVQSSLRQQAPAEGVEEAFVDWH